jgi:hypothetical protein
LTPSALLSMFGVLQELASGPPSIVKHQASACADPESTTFVAVTSARRTIDPGLMERSYPGLRRSMCRLEPG